MHGTYVLQQAERRSSLPRKWPVAKYAFTRRFARPINKRTQFRVKHICNAIWEILIALHASTTQVCKAGLGITTFVSEMGNLSCCYQ
jgi:hypothetical protein